MRILLSSVGLLLLGSFSTPSTAMELVVHLHGGEAVQLPAAEIRRIEFTGQGSGLRDPAAPAQAGPGLQLLPNHPNPANPGTTIEYWLPRGQELTVRILDLRGALVAQLLNEHQSAGWHQQAWDGRDGRGVRVASGVYVYQVAGEGLALSRKLLLLK